MGFERSQRVVAKVTVDPAKARRNSQGLGPFYRLEFLLTSLPLWIHTLKYNKGCLKVFSEVIPLVMICPGSKESSVSCPAAQEYRVLTLRLG